MSEIFKYFIACIGIAFILFLNFDNKPSDFFNLSNISYSSYFQTKVIEQICDKNIEIKKILSYIPNCILYDFHDRGWDFDIWDSDEIEKYIEKGRCLGFCDFTDLKIRVDSDEYLNTLVVWHEFGHYLYDRVGLEKEFEKYYLEADLEKYYSIFDEHGISSASEFFAESFAYYIYSMFIEKDETIKDDFVFEYIDRVYNNCVNTELLCFYENNN